nr:hypothetical protein [Tanacetum cinerariifolium]
ISWDCHGGSGGGGYNRPNGCDLMVFCSGRRWGRVLQRFGGKGAGKMYSGLSV